jgi:hypothetical protein
VTSRQGTIFISCGQWAANEVALGQATSKLVEQLTSYRAHYAQDQSSLQGVTTHILRALNDSVGLIAIMHPRGQITRADGSQIIRASVWIEQEIAIAAFLNQVLDRGLKVKAYIHESIGRDGLRDQLLLNPTIFSEDREVIDDLRIVLGQWASDLPITSKVRTLAEDIADLISSGREIIVSPTVPAASSSKRAYVVAKADDRVAQLREVHSGLQVDVPLSRIEIVWRGEHEEPEFKLQGRLQWLTLRRAWKFFSEHPESQDEADFGFGKRVNASSSEVTDICRELQSRGYQMARFTPSQMRSRAKYGWEVIYDADGQYFEMERVDKRILAGIRWGGNLDSAETATVPSTV